MPPKKGKKEKETPTSAAPEKGGSPDNNDASASDIHCQDQKIEEMIMPSKVASETFKKCLDISLQKIFDNHISKYTDEYAVASSIANISEAIFELFPVIDKPETPRSPSPVIPPPEPHEWTSYTYRNMGEFFQLSIVNEADNLIDINKKLSQKGRKNTQLLPNWLQKPGTAPSVQISLSSSSMASFAKEKQQQKNQIQPPRPSGIKTSPKIKRTLSTHTRSNASLVPKISIMTPQEVDQYNMEEKIQRMHEAREQANKDKKNQASKTQINPARMRQFNRRSAQKKKESMTNSTSNNNNNPSGIKKLPVPPGSGQNTQRLPSVSIVDPRAEAQELRRRQLKMGKLRPQTESEIKLITVGRGKKHSSKSPKKKLPAIRSEQALRNEEMNNYSSNNNVTKLPETLIDSLAISDGTNHSLLENLKLDDFESLGAVQTEVGGGF